MKPSVDIATPWSYWDPHAGPGHWKRHYRDARGCRQSPINITDDNVHFDCNLLRNGPLQFTYDRHDCYKIENAGVTWKIVAKDNCKSRITADYLNGTYTFHDIHAHWGTNSTNGSEHLVNGKGYAAEVHIVNFNEKYQSIEEACKQLDGVAVLAVFLKESNHDTKVFDQLSEYLSQIPYRGQSVPLDRGFNFRKLLPENKDFWTYHGSLTTPPCCECVTWTIFRHPLPISKRQLDIFRSLHAKAEEESSTEPVKICNNVRPAQKLHNRPVRASFKPTNVLRLPPINVSSNHIYP